MKPILVTSGEPAGIGPDLCLELANVDFPVVVLADKVMLLERARQLGHRITLQEYQPEKPLLPTPGCLHVLPLVCPAPVVPGALNVKNVPYVIKQLEMANDLCLQKKFSALVTAPVHKGIVNDAGIPFTGHTEFFANRCEAKQVVMLMVCEAMRVALITTHIPLREVADAINESLIIESIKCLHFALQTHFSIPKPRIWVAGLNPHAGEGGHLGVEEITVITPALGALQCLGIDVQGPFPADTMFSASNQQQCDAFVTMYHDQGLSVLKYAAFHQAVNVTLGLPIIRTSVDHGTALELAGSGRASSGSLFCAAALAVKMAGLSRC